MRRCASTSGRDDVDDAVDHGDDLTGLASTQQLHDTRVGERQRAQVSLWRPGIDLELGAPLAVDCDRDVRPQRSSKLGVVGGPGAARVHRVLMASSLPELFGDKRRKGCEQLQQRVSVDAARCPVRALVVEVASELHEVRDRRVVSKLGDVVLDLLDEAMATASG